MVREGIRSAVVTGASAGIGAAFARLLASQGVPCLMVARRLERLRAIEAELGSDRVTSLACDVTDPGSAERAAAQSEADLVVLNAGFGVYGAFAEASPERLVATIDVNCRALVAWTRAFLPRLLERRRGGLILVASTAGLVPAPFYAVYGATKAFVVAFGRSLASEIEGSGVRVTTVCPGPVATEFFQVAGAPGPLGRPGGGADTPERVAREALAAWNAGRAMHVVGARNRALTVASRLVPAGLAQRVARSALQPPNDGRRRPGPGNGPFGPPDQGR